uniref:Uncharacterized protein n=1 Tax=Oryctolagus cuniculus TaxID=9986 RepID=A0A5F9DKR8_RABIT
MSVPVEQLEVSIPQGYGLFIKTIFRQVVHRTFGVRSFRSKWSLALCSPPFLPYRQPPCKSGQPRKKVPSYVDIKPLFCY